MAIRALLSLPALRLGIFPVDERMQLAALEGHPVNGMRPLDLWRFRGGDPDELAEQIRAGHVPWSFHPHSRLAFLRPLSSALLYVEHALFGRALLPYHAVSLLLSLALLVVVARLYQRVLSGPSAVIATFAFAVQGIQWETIGFFSAVHYLVATIPAVLALGAYLRFREDGWRPGLPLALLGFGLGLAGGEVALQTIAYVLAYELVGARDRWQQRARALLPVALLAVAYVAAYVTLGYGVFASGDRYVDVLAAPERALDRVPDVARMVLALADGFPGASGRTNALMLRYGTTAYALRWWIASAVAAGGALLFVWVVRVAPRDLPERDARAARWLLLGVVLSLVPVLGGMPAARLLVVPGMGFAPLVAMLLRWAWSRSRSGAPSRPAARAGAAVLGLGLATAHGLVAPVALTLNLIRMHDAHEQDLAREASLVRTSAADPAGDEDVVVLSPPPLRLNTLSVREVYPRARPWLHLSDAPGEQTLMRTGPGSFELARQVPTQHDASPSGYPRVGQRIPLRGGLTIEVLEVSGSDDPLANTPLRIAVESQRPLDDPSLCFLAWRDGALRRVSMPAVGESITLAGQRAPR